VLDKWLLMRYSMLVVDEQVSSLAQSATAPSLRPASKSHNPHRIRTCTKYARNSFRIRTYKSKELKVLYNPHLQKMAGGYPCLLTSSFEDGVGA
jgi:hypothetical protein